MPPTRREGSWPWLVKGAIAPTAATRGGVPRGEARSVTRPPCQHGIRHSYASGSGFPTASHRVPAGLGESALALCNIIVFVRLSPQAL